MMELLVDMVVIADNALAWALQQDLTKLANTLYFSDPEGKERLQLLITGFEVIRNSHCDWPSEWDTPSVINIASILQTWPTQETQQKLYKARVMRVMTKSGILLAELIR